MLKKMFQILACTSFILMIGSVYGQSNDHFRKQIRKIIKHDVDYPIEEVPGFIVGIIDSEKTHVIPFGERTQGLGDTLTPDDRFELGSLSKAFNAYMIMQLVAEQYLKLDAPVNDFLPAAYQNPAIDATLEDVLMHYGRLPKIPMTLGATQQHTNDPYANFSREDLLSWYRDLEPDSSKTFRYSHTGYAFLEIIMERATGQPYPTLFKKYIQEGLELPNTTLTTELLVPGYDLAVRPTTPWSFPTFMTSEGVRSSLSDIMRFMQLMIDAEYTTGSLSQNQRVTDHKKIFIAPGLYAILPKPDVQVWMHTGHTSGHAVMFVFAPATKTGVVVLANSAAGTGDLGLLILRMVNKQWRRKS
jgi:CubicO group peptidase (beta-lactamase class C family)